MKSTIASTVVWAAVQSTVAAATAPFGIAACTSTISLEEVSPSSQSPAGEINRDELLRIRVKILVDQHEPAAARVWHDRLRSRVNAASEILERQCGIRLEVSTMERWRADPRVSDFEGLVADFEKRVMASPARLAIAFGGRHSTTGCSQATGPRGPLQSHLVISEWFPGASERNRLELLVHELGHFFGAAHSDQSESVMRPIVADGQSTARKFQLAFDADNARAIQFVRDALRTRDVRRLDELAADEKSRLLEIYEQLRRRLPDDQLAERLAASLRDRPPVPAPAEQPTSLAASTRSVVAAIVDAAQRRHARERGDASAAGNAPGAGDRLTEEFVRVAAAAAMKVAPEHAPAAFLLALGIAIDDSDVLRQNPFTRELCSAIESPAARAERLQVLGSPTVRRRRDWAQHFVVSAALTAQYGPELAESAGLLKEMGDLRGASGFSFTDVSADFAGIALARAVRERPAMLSRIAESFVVTDFLPDPRGLADGLSQEEFQRDYGSASDERFRTVIATIRERIAKLPAYGAK
jgi:hypothetical protein